MRSPQYKVIDQVNDPFNDNFPYAIKERRSPHGRGLGRVVGECRENQLHGKFQTLQKSVSILVKFYLFRFKTIFSCIYIVISLFLLISL